MPFQPSKFQKLSADHYAVLSAIPQGGELKYTDLLDNINKKRVGTDEPEMARTRVLGVLVTLRERKLVDRRGQVPGWWFRTEAGDSYLANNPQAPEPRYPS